MVFCACVICIMVVKFTYWCSRLYSTLKLSKINMNTNKCHFKHLENEVHITFLFKIQEENIRQFNFIRKPSDRISILQTRIASNIQKHFNKINKKKKTNIEIKEDDIKFCDKGRNIVSDIICSDLISKKYPLQLTILDQVYEIVYNAPCVISLLLPQSMLANFPIYPVNCAMQFADKQHSIFNWYTCEPKNEKGNKLSEVHLQWQFKSTEFIYTPKNEDIGKRVKLECIPGKKIISFF